MGVDGVEGEPAEVLQVCGLRVLIEIIEPHVVVQSERDEVWAGSYDPRDLAVEAGQVDVAEGEVS